MNLYECLLFVTHTATQLYGKWLPCPTPPSADRFCGTIIDSSLRSNCAVDALLAEDWEDLILEDMTHAKPCLTWISKLIASRPSAIVDISLAVVEHVNAVNRHGAGILMITDPRYPESLRSIAKPPLALTYMGSLSSLGLRKIAVIGARQASYFAIRETVKVGEFFADREDLCLVSGGAIGCDIAAHQGMLLTRAPRINACVVLAGGIHKFYPRRHEFVFDQIIQRGGIILSERLWWQASTPRDFPIRNRIVSGLSESVVVTQAGESSGSLITANEALEQGRDVYVLEHDPQDVRALGSHRLVEDGAIAFKAASDLETILFEGLEGASDRSFYSNTCHLPSFVDTVKGEQTIQ